MRKRLTLVMEFDFDPARTTGTLLASQIETAVAQELECRPEAQLLHSAGSIHSEPLEREPEGIPN